MITFFILVLHHKQISCYRFKGHVHVWQIDFVLIKYFLNIDICEKTILLYQPCEMSNNSNICIVCVIHIVYFSVKFYGVSYYWCLWVMIIIISQLRIHIPVKSKK